MTGLGSGAELLLRLLRTKAVALLLGPGGVGLISIFTAIVEAIHGPATAGFGASGVQQLAQRSDDGSALRRQVFVIRGMLAGLAGVGALAVLLGRQLIATVSFGDTNRSGDVGLLALVVMLAAVAAGNTTILQGLRRIRALALIAVISTLLGSAGTVILLHAFGEGAVVPSLVVAAAATAAVSCWYVRDLPVRPPAGALQALLREGRGLFALGSIFVLTHLLTVLTDYAVRLLVLHSLEIRGAGLFQAAWTLGGIYVGFVLNAMATDFYPRLSAVAHDDRECNRLVNEQVEVGLLLAGPGILACLTLAPWLVTLCYSDDFSPAVDLFRLVLVGMLLRVITWPLGYILRAKRHGHAVLWTEVAKNLLHLAFSFALIRHFGLAGAGLAFVLTYVACLGMMVITSRTLTGFRFNHVNLRLTATYGIMLLLLLAAILAGGEKIFVASGLAATLAAILHSARRLSSLGALQLLPLGFQRMLGRLVPAQSHAQQAGTPSADTPVDATPPAPIAPPPHRTEVVAPPSSTSLRNSPRVPPYSGPSARLRLLVALASHGLRNLPHLRRIIEQYRSLPFDVDVVVLSESPKDLGTDVRVLVGLPTRNPWSLPFAHHPLFISGADHYDLFLYSEDDIAISESNLRAFLRVTPHLQDDEIAGFMRVETDADGRTSLPDAHGAYHWKPDSVRRRGGEVFAHFSNEHAAFYVLTRAQLRRAISSGGFGLPPRSGRYDMLCTAATDPYTSCGMTKLVCVSDLDGFLVEHLSGRYLGKLGPTRATFQAQIDALLRIASGDLTPHSLLAPARRNNTAGGAKVLYERNVEPFLQAVPSNAATILSVGCGSGNAEARLRQRGARVTALPVDAVIGASAAAQGIEVINGTLPEAMEELGRRRFDCVVVPGVLHLVDDPADLVARCTRLLAAGGSLAVIGPNVHSLPARWRRLVGGRLPIPTDGRDYSDPVKLSRTLRALGLTVEPIRWLGDRSAGEDSGAHSRRQILLRRTVRLLGRVGSGRAFATTWILRATSEPSHAGIGDRSRSERDRHSSAPLSDTPR